jgi:hypothetical protein
LLPTLTCGSFVQWEPEKTSRSRTRLNAGATERLPDFFGIFSGIFLESRKASRLGNRDRTFGFTHLSSPDRRIKQLNRRYRSLLMVLWLTL